MSKRKRTSSAPGPTIIPGLGPDLPELQRARTLWQHNRYDEALALFEAAVRKCPNNLVALIDASRALGARFEVARAEILLDRLLHLGPDNPHLLQLVGQSYRMIFRPEKALHCFRRSLHLQPDNPETLLELAVFHERRHHLPDAAECVQRCLRAAPDYPPALLIEARLRRRQQDEAGSQSLLRRLAADAAVHPLARAQAFYDLGQALDRQDACDDAMAAFEQGKEFLRREEGPIRRESDLIVGILRGLVDELTPEHCARWAAEARDFPRKRVALLTSFPRSGTTLLEQVLDSHPELISSDEREAFARDIFPALWQGTAVRLPTLATLDAVPPARLLAQRERYLNYMSAALAQPIGDRMHLDKNPPFTLLIPAMLRVFPECRLVIALRDPRDVVLSCFMQYLPLNTNSVCYLTLERAVARYVTDMGAWLKLREVLPSSWVEIRYEDAVADLEREARRALEFLGLAWDPQVMNYRARLQSKVVSSPTYEAVSQPLYTRAIGRWRRYARYFEPLQERLRPFVRAFGYAD